MSVCVCVCVHSLTVLRLLLIASKRASKGEQVGAKDGLVAAQLRQLHELRGVHARVVHSRMRVVVLGG